MFAIEQRFEKLERQIEIACFTEDPQIADGLRRYGTVLICGFVERSVEVVILERLKNRAHPKVINFVKSHFKKGSNYHCETISQLLERFEPSWRDHFRKFMEGNAKQVDALLSTYNVRNSVAHGGDHGISAAVLKERCADAKLVVDAVIEATKQ